MAPGPLVYNLIMVILFLDCICHLIIPSVILASLTSLTHCFKSFKSFEIITHKLVSSVTDCKTSLFIEQWFCEGPNSYWSTGPAYVNICSLAGPIFDTKITVRSMLN